MNNEEKIIGMLETLTTDVSGLKSNDEKIFGVLETLTADITGMKAELTALC